MPSDRADDGEAGRPGLVRGLGPWHAAALVVGTIIGTGDAAPVAARAAATFLGDSTQALLAVAMTISALSAMAGSMLTRRAGALRDGARRPGAGVAAPARSLVGLALIAAGAPVYALFHRRR